MYVVVPVGSHVYRYLGPAFLLFFALTKFFQGELSVDKLKRFRINKSICLFILLLILSCISFVPQTVGTMLIFATLNFGIKEKVLINRIAGKVVLAIFLLVLVNYTFMYVHKIPLYGVWVNPTTLAYQFTLFFLCCAKASFVLGQLSTVVCSIFITARTLHANLLVYFLFQFPILKKRLSAKVVAIYLCSMMFLMIIAGAFFADKIITVPKRPRRGGYSLELRSQTLDRLSTGRLKINNFFFQEIAGDYRKILFGDGEKYYPKKKYRERHPVKKPNSYFEKIARHPVHNSFLEIFAQHGILFLVVFLILLYSYIEKLGDKQDFPIILSIITCGILANGMFNTFPLILLLSLLLLKTPSNSS